jgi:SNF2 family DNA or RNA helicase
VFYSDDFKVIIRERAITGAGIRLNEDTNLLEFSFDAEDIDSLELMRLMAALREKKRYYRLKDGTFLSLEGRELIGLAQIADDLGLKDKDLTKGLIALPRYRALYLDRQLREFMEDEPVYQPAFKKLLEDVQNPGLIQIVDPTSLMGILRDYQRVGFRWLKTLARYGLGGILADDMGLGKTLQVLTLLLSEKEEGNSQPSLVVAPTSLIYNWEDEVQKFVPGLTTVIITGSKAERKKALKKISNVDLAITSYPLIRRDKEEYKEFSFRYCIIDEAQHIKNPRSQNARAVKSISAKYRFALTGTPIENSLTELWSIFDFIMPGYLFGHAKFLSTYEKAIVKDQDKEVAEDLATQIRPFVLRRLKVDVLKELPEKIENKMMTELTEDQKKVYLAYLAKVKGEIFEEIDIFGYEKSHIKILSAITRLRQICCHPGLFLENYKGESVKLQQLEDIVPDALAGGHRILLFSQFTSMLKLIQQRMEKLKIPCFYLDGTTEAQERNQMVKRFNEGQKKIFLISLKAGGTGLNLTGADMVIHFDPWWNPAVEEQASDRAYRIGQQKVVHVMRLITRGTIEEKIEKLKEKKRSLAETVIRPGETLISKLSREEIMGLFE